MSRLGRGQVAFLICVFSLFLTPVLKAGVTPPSAITNLRAYQSGTPNVVRLNWTTQGDDDTTGTLSAGSSYRIQYSTQSPTSVVWSTNNAQVVIATEGVAPGISVSTYVALSLNQLYYFHIWTIDESGNVSPRDVTASTATAFNTPFSFESVDGMSGTDVGIEAKMAMDKDNNMHVVYRNSSTSALNYIKRTGSSWGSVEVVEAVTAGHYGSIAIDEGGNPHVAFEVSSHDLKYARRTSGGTWVVSTVETTGDVGTYTSIAIDGLSRPHIAYYDDTNDDLKYARWIGNRWSTTTVDSGGSVGTYAALALDDRGRPNIAYYDSTSTDLKYASYDGTTWSTSTAHASAQQVGTYLSLVLNGSGDPRIAYYNNSSGDLLFARRDTGSWTLSTADSVDFAGHFTGITLDGDGNPHISYRATPDFVNMELRYARYNGVSWSTMTIDSVNSACQYTSIAIDSVGDVHITYQNNSLSDLKAAHWTGAGVSASMGGNKSGKVQGPTSLARVSITTETITWGWTNNQVNATAVRVYSATSSVYSDNSGALAGAANSWTQTNLTANTSYQTYVAVFNAGGIVTSSSAIAFTAAHEFSGTTITNVTQDTVTINWLPGSNIEPGTNYEVFRATENSFVTPTQTTVSTSGITVTNLLPSTTYWFKVRALNGDSVGTNFDVTVSTKTNPTADGTAPGKITGLTALWSGTSGVIRLSWVSPGDDSFTGVMPAGSEFRVQFTTASPSSITWSTMSAQVVMSTYGMSPGVKVSTFVHAIPDAVNYFRVWAKDESNNNYSVVSDTMSVYNNPFITTRLDNQSGSIFTDFTSLAFDHLNNAHLAYQETPTLYYRKRTGTVWGSATAIDTGPNKISLAVDGNGYPMIAYGQSGTLKIAKFNGLSWSTSTVEASDVGDHCALAIDGGNQLHIAYSDDTNGTLKYARFNGVSWTTSTINAGSSGGWNTSITINASGHPRIAYSDIPQNITKYAEYDGSSWQLSNTDSIAGKYISLAINGSNQPFISYYYNFGAAGQARYTTYSGGWSDFPLDNSGGDQGAYSSMLLDGNGNMMASHHYANTPLLRLARYTGSSWYLVNIDTTAGAGWNTSMAVDGNGGIMISHLNYQQTDLMITEWANANVTRPMGGNNRGKTQAPYGMHASALTTNSISWAWTKNHTNATEVRVYAASSTPYVDLSGAQAEGTVSYDQTGLSANRPYAAFVMAKNAGGIVTSSAATVYTAAFAPTGLSVLSFLSSTAILDWTANGNPEPGTTYQVWRATENSFVTPTINSVSYTSFSATGLSADTNYWFKVRALNGDGIATAFDVSVSTIMALDGIAPAGISNLTALSAFANGGIHLSWTAPGNDGASGDIATGRFIIKYSSSQIIRTATFDAPSFSVSSVTISTGVVAGSPQGVSLTGLLPGVTYWFAIKATDENNNASVWVSSGDNSSVNTSAVAMAGDVTPSLFQSIVLSSASINWEWSTVSNASAYRLITSTGGVFVQLSHPTSFYIQTGMSANTSSFIDSVQSVNAGVIGGTRTHATAPVYTLAQIPSGTSIPTVIGFTMQIDWTSNGNAEPGTTYHVWEDTDSAFTSPTQSIVATTSHTASGLSSNTTYWFKVRAVNGDGVLTGFDVSVSSFIYADSFAPAAISNLAAQSGSSEGQIHLTWTSPGDDGTSGNLANGSFVLKYSTVQIISAASFNAPTFTVSSMTVSTTAVTGSAQGITLSNLIRGASYWFAIKALDDQSMMSVWNSSADVPSVNNSAYAFSSDDVPVAPQNFQLSAQSPNSISLTWSAPSPDPGDITWYNIYFDSDTTGAPYNSPITGITGTSYVLTGLSTLSTYYIAIRAVDDGPLVLMSAYSTEVSTFVFPTRPPAPPLFSATVLSTSTINWEWTPVENATAYRLVTATDGVVIQLAHPTTYYAQSTLTPNTSSHITGIQTLNTAGLGGTRAETSVPVYTFAAPPSGTSILSASTSAIHLDWSANGNAEPGTIYHVWEDTESAFTSPSQQSVALSSHVATGLTLNTTYWFKVRAVNADNVTTIFDAVVSTFVSARPDTPSSFTATTVSTSSLHWQWTTVLNASAYQLLTSSGGVFAELSHPTSFYAQSNLAANTSSYISSVRAINSIGNSDAASLSNGPRFTWAAAPTDSSLTGVFISSLTLTWSAAGNSNGTTYQLQYWKVGAASVTVELTGSSALLTSLTPGATYHLRVRALNHENIATDYDTTLDAAMNPLPSVTQLVPRDSDATVTLDIGTGEVQLQIESGTFAEDVTVTVRPTDAPETTASLGGGLIGTGIAIDITLDKDIQPGKDVRMSIGYQSDQIDGLDEERLIVTRYVPERGAWLPLLSRVNSDDNTVVGHTNHFSLFQVMQAVPAASLSNVIVYPNPLRPALNHTWMTFNGLPSEAKLTIFTINGEFVDELTADGTGMARWNGTNDQGSAVGSGVYLVLIEGAGQKSTVKVAVQR